MRSMAVLFLTLLFIVGIGVYLVRFAKDANKWVAFPVNKHLYSNASLKRGEITDKNGMVLLSVDEKGKAVYNENKTVRMATLHAVGDRKSNIATGAQSKFAYLLGGYSKLNGTYSLDGAGGSIVLTLDASVCAEAYRAMDGRKGTIAVYNYKTGDVLCMISTPTFDPDSPPKSVDGDKYKGVYLNRFLSSTFIPGSTFKLVTTAALLEYGFDPEDFSYTCKGKTEIDGTTVTCTAKHGKVDFGKALTKSCNCAYAELSQLLGEEKLMFYAARCGLLTSCDVSGIECAAGSMDPSGSRGALGWSAIGQGNDLVNPAAMLTFVGSIANDGNAQYPNLISAVRSSLGSKIPYSFGNSGGRYMKSSTAETLRKMMRDNVLNNYGEKRFKNMELCAKSGTAEVDGEASHSWFVGFSVREDFPVAFVSLIENGGWGSGAAGDAASKVLKKCAESMGVDLSQKAK